MMDTELGREMSQFPLEPQLSRLLLLAIRLRCVEDVLTVAAMMSVENVWMRPHPSQFGETLGEEEFQEELREAERKREAFTSIHGDFISLLCVRGQN